MDLSLSLRRLGALDMLPMELLLLADETQDAIGKYIPNSDVYVVDLAGEPKPIAICAWCPLVEQAMEIKNIAVAEAYQSQGIGSWLLAEMKRLAAINGYTSVWVGTADAAYSQHRFYRRNGFVKAGVRKNFFLENYPEPIMENGVRLVDMILFRATIGPI